MTTFDLHPDELAILALWRYAEADIPDVLAQIGAQVERIRSAEAALLGKVAAASFSGATWKQIAEALGVTDDVAWKQYQRQVSQIRVETGAMLDRHGCSYIPELLALTGGEVS